ncbi:hypothetical protein [Jiangella gansuensis]|uniref:hypothetical protein n=1 Tax=Jiangella gansuensis TaxID=281473 RepID=UPI000479E41F|nr:hypothetical protein [Jiangella gansuensis]
MNARKSTKDTEAADVEPAETETAQAETPGAATNEATGEVVRIVPKPHGLEAVYVRGADGSTTRIVRKRSADTDEPATED